MLVNFFQYFLQVNIYWFNIKIVNVIYHFAFAPLTLSAIPLIYLYVISMTEENFRFTKKTLLHFLPAFTILIIIASGILMIDEDARSGILFEQNVEAIYSSNLLFSAYRFSILMVFIQALVYFYVMLRKLYLHDKNILNLFSSKEEISLTWLKIFVAGFLIYYVFEFSTLFIGKFFLEIPESIYFSIVSLHIFFVGYMGLRQREVFPLIKIEKEELHSSLDFEKTETSESNLAHIISDEMKEEVAFKITELLEKDKIFLNSELSMFDLSEKLDINKNYLSHIINEVFELNFFNLINKYRIEEAKKMLTDPQYDHLSVEGIAKSVGFNSRNVFYPVFKKFCDMTPAEYKQINRKD